MKEKNTGKTKAWIFIAVALVGILIANYFFLFETKSFNIPDRCGAVAGSVLHSIETKEMCDLRCKSQCEAENSAYGSSKFTIKDKGCNECICNCRI